MVLLVKYGFETLKLHRISGITDALNSPMRTLFDKIGFQFEGIQRDVCRGEVMSRSG